MTKRATYQDVLDAPEYKVAEILDGELFLSPMLAPRVGVVHSALLAIVGNAFDRGEPGGWWIFPKPEVHLGEQVIVPAEPFEAIELELGRLWPDEAPAAPATR